MSVLTASDEALQQDIRYTNEELDDLIQRTTEEAKSNETGDPAKKADKTFAFARVWEGRSRGLAGLEKVGVEEETSNVQDQRSFWDSILQANQEEERAAAESKETETGRGRRKRRDVAYAVIDDFSPKKRRTGDLSDHDDDFQPPDQLAETSDSEYADLPGENDNEDLIVMPAGYPPPSDMVKKATAAEKNRRKSEDRRKSEAYNQVAFGATYFPTAAPGNGVLLPPQKGSFQHNPTPPQHPIASQSDVHHSTSHNHARPPKLPEIARMKLPDLTGLSQTEKKREMDSTFVRIKLSVSCLSLNQ